LMIKHIQVHSTATNIILCKLLLVYVISVGEFILIEQGEVILGYTTSLFDSRHVKFNCISVGFLTIFFNLKEKLEDPITWPWCELDTHRKCTKTHDMSESWRLEKNLYRPI